MARFKPTRREALAAGMGFLLNACTRQLTPPRYVKPEPYEHPRNVVIYLADSLRADHLGCYGHQRETSPAIDALARESVVFEQCMSAGSWTTPGISSLFTACPPIIHSMMWGEWCERPLPILSPDLATMDEPFAAGGYETAWFLGNPNCTKNYGLGRGFQNYRYAYESPHEQMDHVLQWLADKPSQPFYLFVHQNDPHNPYRSTTEEFKSFTGKTHEEMLSELPDADADMLHDAHKLGWNKRIERTGLLPLQNLSPDGLAYAQLLYDTEIRRVDQAFKRLCVALKDAGLYDDTIVVFTSDHGEAFAEHGACYHGNNVYNEELHVPLIMKLPKPAKPRRIAGVCSQCDVAPTLLALTGQDPLPYAQGAPLLDREGNYCVEGNRPITAYHTSCAERPEDLAMGLYHGNAKFIRNYPGGATEFYNLAEDPQEQQNGYKLGLGHERALVDLAQSVREAQLEVTRKLTPGGTQSESSDEHKEALEALGYL